jgi:hypothetical protein
MTNGSTTIQGKRHEYAACSRPALGWTEGQPQE